MASGPHSIIAAYVPTEIAVKLTEEAERLQITKSNLMRRILKAHLEEQEDESKEDHLPDLST